MFADVNLRLSAERMIVVPNGCASGSAMPVLEPEPVHSNRSATSRSARNLGFPADSPVLVNVASINPVKGQGLLIDAFAIAHAKRPDIRLVILGKHSDAGYPARLGSASRTTGCKAWCRCPATGPACIDSSIWLGQS
jgi:glycosyltransferase involved in cell wall biosynthesis